MVLHPKDGKLLDDSIIFENMIFSYEVKGFLFFELLLIFLI